MSAGALRSELLKARLDRFTRMLHGVEHGETHSVHRARVASRRLRELMPVLALRPDASKKLGRRLRQVTIQLGIARELDVLLMLVDELQRTRPHLAHAIEQINVNVAKARDEARRQLFEDLPVDQLWKLARKLGRVIDDLREDEKGSRALPGAKAVRWTVDARVVRRAARLQSAIEMAGAVYLPERLHAVRIALKKLRYAVELAGDVAGQKKPVPVLRTLKRGQDVLGRMHDFQVLIDRVRDVQTSLTPPNVSVWRELDDLILDLEDECRRLHARYVRHRPALASITGKLAGRPPDLAQKRRAG
jgi:CHAD domain-containing protein